MLAKLNIFGFSILFILSSTSLGLADNICHLGGGNDISMSIKVADSNEALQVAIDQRYFDQRFIPRDGSERDALGLKLQATDFSPWPKGLRAHQSEGPYLKLLVSHFASLELVAQGSATTALG